MHFSLKWVPSLEALLLHNCLNYATSTDSSSSSGEHFSDSCCLEIGVVCMNLIPVSSQFYTKQFT